MKCTIASPPPSPPPPPPPPPPRPLSPALGFDSAADSGELQVLRLKISGGLVKNAGSCYLLRSTRRELLTSQVVFVCDPRGWEVVGGRGYLLVPKVEAEAKPSNPGCGEQTPLKSEVVYEPKSESASSARKLQEVAAL
ncbi:uncharacterized protein V6R79_013191 [Siganus canaliculatus]